MTVTAKDLRFNISMLFDVLSKGEEILITYRGKAKAKLISYDEETQEKSDDIFGLWKDRDEDINRLVRDMRKGRNFDI
jgi:antitoxin (DNA-binding transcriptional repressor) of toxin-antitoxin stability system